MPALTKDSTEMQVARNAGPAASWLAMSLGMPAELFLRHNFGRRYLKANFASGYVGLFVLLLLGLLSPPSPLGPPFLLFLGIGYLARYIYLKAELSSLEAEGVQMHSRYNGAPHPAWSVLVGEGASDGIWIKSFAEPALLASAGVLLWMFDQSLGLYFFLFGVGLFVRGRVVSNATRERVMDLQDAQYDATEFAASPLTRRRADVSPSLPHRVRPVRSARPLRKQ